MLVALVQSALKYKQMEPRALRLVTWTLLIAFVTQWAAYFYSKYTHKSNHFIFNLQILPVYGGQLLLYARILSQRRFKLAASVLFIAFVVTYLLRIFVFGSLTVFDSTSITIGEFATLCCCMFYLVEVLATNNRLNLFAMPMFWITTGLVVTVVGDFLYIAAFDYILAHNMDPTGNIMGTITTCLSVVEYTCFSIAFYKVGKPAAA
ncbi:hypothetical protein BC343_09875 [Mucilaginibacter pedocola]|uniref:Uncharacterized protein n=2 Tax=Mucilaginibacter pedocola TaxID=1792845 RepID=A0A1S9PAH3_9SPHI|nr:hypothetical protein BC343_09875 [Mucilaginibacter pedocola]